VSTGKGGRKRQKKRRKLSFRREIKRELEAWVGKGKGTKKPRENTRGKRERGRGGGLCEREKLIDLGKKGTKGKGFTEKKKVSQSQLPNCEQKRGESEKDKEKKNIGSNQGQKLAC